MTSDTIGVDISKDHLDAHRLSDGTNRRFTNDKTGHRAFLNWAGQPGSRIVYEPTGPYHRSFERKLAQAAHALVKVNPRQARRFAEATGKTRQDRPAGCRLAGTHGGTVGARGAPATQPSSQ